MTRYMSYFAPSAMRFALNFICVLLFALRAPVDGQQLTKIPRIGYLTAGSVEGYSRNLEAFREGLRDLGYVEGKNVTIEYRYADGQSERLPKLAEELVRLDVDIIVASSSTAARPARKATSKIPIVIASSGNLDGLVATLARPGGNVTGLYQYSPELFGKRLELLKEVVPDVSRFTFLNGTDGTAAKSEFDEQGPEAAKALGVQIQPIELKAPAPNLEGAFRSILKQRIGAVVTSSSPLIQYHRKKIFTLLNQNRIPAMHSIQQWASEGGLMAYGVDHQDLYRRAATFVDKILKGAKPAELPVEQPTKFEFSINLNTAKQIGLTIPPAVLARADKVIR